MMKILKHISALSVVITMIMMGAMRMGEAAQAQDDLRNQLAAIAARQYERCLRQARTNPTDAITTAMQWRDEGGGLPARHCLAIAQAGEGNFAMAARTLEDVAEDLRAGRGLSYSEIITRGDRVLLADLYAQAGNLWMLADDGAAAYGAFSQGLVEAPAVSDQALELLIDRARSLADLGELQAASEDLSTALMIDEFRVDALVLLASARRMLEDEAGAQVALDKALALDSNYPEALLEKGNLHLLRGENDGARDAWLQLIMLYPDSQAAEAARRNIERLDIN